jgi:hypothetical protein
MQSSELINSSSVIVKVVVGISAIVVGLIVLRLLTSIISSFFDDSGSPVLIDGMVDAKHLVIYPQDPAETNSMTIYRSVDENKGIEFTWSTWIFIDNLQYRKNVYRNIFYKGNRDLQANGLNNVIHAPGLYIAPNTNALVVFMNTFEVIDNEILIPNIPLNKWLNIIIRCRNTTLDIYVNGTITRSVELMGIPRQNYGDVHVASGGGFDGFISNLRYFNRAIGVMDIDKIVEAGPNTDLIGTSEVENTGNSSFLSLRWFFGSNFTPPPSIKRIHSV